LLEGNRRVAALKAIQNPYLAPEYQARITKLTQTLPNLNGLKKITVKRAPNQDQADQVIAALHTGNQRVPWGPLRQAAFFQAQIDSGKTYEQLVVQYPTIDVKEFVVRSRILNLFRSVKYKDPSLVDYIKRRRFPVSTLARLYDYDKFR
jgi:regulatory protein YycH of two-component signal transduction system YycFG